MMEPEEHRAEGEEAGDENHRLRVAASGGRNSEALASGGGKDLNWQLHLLAAISPGSTFANYWHRLTDRTFVGQYQANTFDLAVMLPYFIVLVVLAAYGIHRYALVYNYYKYRNHSPGPPPAVTEWPKVTIQLPIFNERYVIERLVDCVAQFDYPRELLEIQVLDDSTDETREVARNCVERHRSWGCRFVTFIATIARDSRRGLCSRDDRGDRRIDRDFRCGFSAAGGFFAADGALFCGAEAGDGADAVELYQPAFFGADGD